MGPRTSQSAPGSTQLTHDLFRILLDPGDTVLLMDPTYANYEGQLAFAAPGVKVARLRLLDPQTWRRLVEAMQARSSEAGAWLAIDFAYKCQLFAPMPAYYSWSPTDYPNVVGIHSNSKWGRGLGRRLGWITAAPPLVEAIERVQQCSLLCPDTLSQMAMTRYLTTAIDDGSLDAYVAETNELYRDAARVTVAAVDEHLGRPRLDPMGGLYTVVDVGVDAEDFVPGAFKATGVLVVPGGGFGPSLASGVRISYGPLVLAPEKIREGIARLGSWGGWGR